MFNVIDEDDWGRIKMGRFSDADEVLVRRVMGPRFSKNTNQVSQKLRSFKHTRNNVTIRVIANRVNCLVQGPSYSARPQAFVKALSTRKTITATKRLIDYVARTRRDDKRDGIYGSIKMRDALGRELTLSKTRSITDDWGLMPDVENLSKRARKAISQGDFGTVENMKDEDKHYYVQAWHFALSINETKVTDQFQAAVKATIRNIFAKDGYQCIWGIHSDHTDNVHAHVVANAVNKHGERLRSDINGDFLHNFRIEFAQNLRLSGLDYEATRREDRRPMRDQIMAGFEPLRNNKKHWTRHQHPFEYSAEMADYSQYMSELRQQLSQATTGIYGDMKVTVANHLIRKNIDQPLHHSIWQRIKNKFQKDEVPPEYKKLVKILIPYFHEPKDAVKNWQKMAMTGSHRDQFNQVQRPCKSRANWELLNRPELFSHITTRAHELRQHTELKKMLKNIPLPVPEQMDESQIDLEHIRVQELKRITYDREKTITSLKRLLDQINEIEMATWWPDVVENAINQAKTIEIGDRKTIPRQPTNSQLPKPVLNHISNANADDGSDRTELISDPLTQENAVSRIEITPKSTKAPITRKGSER